MVRNRIKVKRAEIGISATTLAERLPDITSKVAMSFVEQGLVLPTKDALMAMCDVLCCKPTDLYAPDDIDLCAAGLDTETANEQQGLGQRRRCASKSFDSTENSHKGMEQLRVWLPADEKAALVKAIAGLGYHSVAEWLREQYRMTLRHYIALQLKDKSIHDAIAPTEITEINLSEVD